MSGALSQKRWGGGGLLLALLLLVLLLAPLWKHRGIDHPLAGAENLDLCTRLPPAPLPLGELRTDASRAGTCTYRDALGNELLTVMLSSTRELSSGGGAADTQKHFETWRKEVRVSYGNWTDLPVAKEGWRHAGAWKSGERQSLIFEDGGVLVVLMSTRLDLDHLTRYAQLVQQTLRAKK